MSLAKLKALLPGPVRRQLSKLRAVVRRLSVWRQISITITGADQASCAILKSAVRRSVITVWRDLDRWQFPMVEHDCTVNSQGAGTFRVRAWTDDLFHVLPGQEPAVEDAIRSALGLGDVFVDAGSNIGYYTITASKTVGPHGRVLACEMMPLTASILRKHVEMNGAGNVSVIEGALADKEGEVLIASYPDGKFGQASIVRGSQGSEVAVRTRTLEAILDQVSQVRIMKMDLEGAELGALRGLGPSISKVEAIVVENRNDPEVLRFLTSHGFEVSRIDDNNVLAQRKSGD